MILRARFLHSFCLVLSLFVTLACGKDSPTEPVPAPQVPARVELSLHSATLTAVGQTVKISATVLDQEGKVITGARVSWTTLDADIARVDASGLVTAAANGQYKDHGYRWKRIGQCGR